MIDITPYIQVIGAALIALVGGVIAFVVWITKQINKITTAIAVLVTETRAPIKLVNEVIDLKVASAELNEKVKTLWNDREDEITENKDEINRIRRSVK